MEQPDRIPSAEHPINDFVRFLHSFSPEDSSSVVSQEDILGITENKEYSFQFDLHVPLKGEKELMEGIIEGKKDVFLLTGVPGVGKSEFMKQLYKKIGSARLAKDNRKIEIIHDATIPDNPKHDASEKLREKLDEFARPNLEIRETNKGTIEIVSVENEKEKQFRSEKIYVIGINRGMLERTFLRDREKNSLWKTLGKSVARLIDEPSLESENVLIVPFELITTVNPIQPSKSFLYRLIDKISDEAHWEKQGCKNCNASSHCPFFMNALLLREEETRIALHTTLTTLYFSTKRRVTIRNVLAWLSRGIVGHSSIFQNAEHPCSWVQNYQVTSQTRRLNKEKEFEAQINLITLLLPNSLFDLIGFESNISSFFKKAVKELFGEKSSLNLIECRERIGFLGEIIHELDPSYYWNPIFDSFASDLYTILKEDLPAIQYRSQIEKIMKPWHELISKELRGRLERENKIAIRNKVLNTVFKYFSLVMRRLLFFGLLEDYNLTHYLIETSSQDKPLQYLSTSASPNLVRFIELINGALKEAKNQRQGFQSESESVYRIFSIGVTRSERLKPSENRNSIKIRINKPSPYVDAILEGEINQNQSEIVVANPRGAKYIDYFPRELILKLSIGNGNKRAQVVKVDLDFLLYNTLNNLAENYSAYAIDEETIEGVKLIKSRIKSHFSNEIVTVFYTSNKKEKIGIEIININGSSDNNLISIRIKE